MTIAMPDEKLRRKSFGASPEATEHNMEFMVQQFKKLNENKTKYTFRQWLNKMMNLLDLID
tara:strand:+ start:331 stop:513 length:183 start_codon:yes stop_codon:yes gene_type:complete